MTKKEVSSKKMDREGIDRWMDLESTRSPYPMVFMFIPGSARIPVHMTQMPLLSLHSTLLSAVPCSA